MWIMTNIGAFFPARKPVKALLPDQALDTLQIRARQRVHLDRLRNRYMGHDLGRIYEIPNSDYEFRADCTAAAWTAAMVKMSLDIDYVSFKDTAVDDRLHSAYLKIWYAIQSTLGTPRSGTRLPHTYQADAHRPQRPARRLDPLHPSVVATRRPFEPAAEPTDETLDFAAVDGGLDGRPWTELALSSSERDVSLWDLDGPTDAELGPDDDEIQQWRATADDAATCTHEAWEDRKGARWCADCGTYLGLTADLNRRNRRHGRRRNSGK